MSKKRKVYSPKMKLQVVLELLSGRKTQAQITSEYGVHASQQIKWKKQLLEHGAEVFEDKRLRITRENNHEKQIEKLYQQIGQLSVERDWLQKKIG
jgi:transposase-like protein